MKRRACLVSLILAATAPAPAALAGPDILKCVDRAGHVTLTDQPCPPGTSGERMPIQQDNSDSEGGSGAAGGTGSGGAADATVLPDTSAVEHYPAPPAPPPPAGPPVRESPGAPFARDAATLKAAHAQLLILDGSRPKRSD